MLVFFRFPLSSSFFSFTQQSPQQKPALSLQGMKSVYVPFLPVRLRLDIAVNLPHFDSDLPSPLTVEVRECIPVGSREDVAVEGLAVNGEGEVEDARREGRRQYGFEQELIASAREGEKG